MSSDTKTSYGFTIRRIPDEKQVADSTPEVEQKQVIISPVVGEKPEQPQGKHQDGNTDWKTRHSQKVSEISDASALADSPETNVSSGGRFKSSAQALSFINAIAGSGLVQEAICRKSTSGSWWVEVGKPVDEVAHLYWTSGGQPFRPVKQQWAAIGLGGEYSAADYQAEILNVSNWNQVELSDLLSETALSSRPLTSAAEIQVIAPPTLSRWILRRATSLGVRVGIISAMSSPLHRNNRKDAGVSVLRLRMDKGDVPLSLIRAIANLPYAIVTRSIGLDDNRLLVDVHHQVPISETLLSRMVPERETWVLGSVETGHWKLSLQGIEIDGATLLNLPTLETFELSDKELPRLPEPIEVRLIKARDNGRVDAVLLDDQELDWIRVFMANRPASEAAFIVPGPGVYLFIAPGGLSGLLPFGLPLTHLQPGGLFLEAGFDFYPALPEIARRKTFKLEDGVVVVATENKIYRLQQKSIFPAWALWVGESTVMDIGNDGFSDRIYAVLDKIEKMEPASDRHAGYGKKHLPEAWVRAAKSMFGFTRPEKTEGGSVHREQSLQRAQEAELDGNFIVAAEIMEALGDMRQAGRLYEKAAGQCT